MAGVIFFGMTFEYETALVIEGDEGKDRGSDGAIKPCDWHASEALPCCACFFPSMNCFDGVLGCCQWHG